MERMKNDASLTVSQAADMLGVSPATIRRAIDKGELPGFRIPGSSHRRIPRAAIEAILDQIKQTWHKTDIVQEA